MDIESNPNKNSGELLYRIDERVSEILRRMNSHETSITNLSVSNELAHDTFDSRIRALENFRWWFLGVAAAAGSATSVIKDWIVQ